MYCSMQESATRPAGADAEIKVTSAAIGAYGTLLVALGRKVTTHPFADGGLICEDRTRWARPTLWRISPEGAVLPDTSYSFAQRTFVTSALPPGV